LKTLIASCLFVLMFLLPAYPADSLLFRETFDAGALDRWQPTDPKAWELHSDSGNTCYALIGKSDFNPPYRSPLSFSLIKNLVVTRFTMELDLKQTGRIYGHQDLCLFFGYQDPSHFYYVHLGRQADAHANSIFIVNDSARVSIATERTEGTAWTTSWHHVKLVRDPENGQIRVYFDDMTKPVMLADDKTFLWGQIGVGSFDDTGCFDNIEIRGRLKQP
jgi:hypothetical protein